MTMKMERSLKYAFWAIWALIVGTCACFIVFHAQWCIGDDAIIMNHTGSGIPFSPSDTILPGLGRFYPFAYLAYDILLPFSSGYLPATAHYWIHLAWFVVLSLSTACLFLSLFESQAPIWKYSLSLFSTFVIVFRLYPDYLNVFSSIWGSYTLLGVFVYLCWMFHAKRNAVYAILALVVINYAQFCLECEFVIPLSMGAGGILFLREEYNKGRWFFWALAGSGLLYLALYGTMVFPHIKHAYDGAHGSGVTLLSNAIRMFIGNKIVILALVTAAVRAVDWIRHRWDYTFFDNLLLAGLAFTFACYVLRLNWTMYYNLGAILVFPAVVHFSHQYLKSPLTLAILAALLCLYGHKLPRVIRSNQTKRTTTAVQMESLVQSSREGKTLYWYCPEAPYGKDAEQRTWKENSLRSYIQWMLRDPSFDFEIRESFEADASGIWLECRENDLLAPDREKLSDHGKECFVSSGIKGYLCP